ncbi:hypothetical protein [Solimonas marina]|uniref:Uncharacterized protein n=1 Tax=Solimonas marina TaxID=2714601 RepID=A0A970B5C5_9GAMM|nr:hypothetical protein [Solimonas marina]NKF21563.1 hypothetical protein [Solimonas marina]
MTEKLYAERDVIQQADHYFRHVMAMTAEGLHSKADVAAELAHRDIEIERLRAALEKIACRSQDDYLLWWQIEARDALKPNSN